MTGSRDRERAEFARRRAHGLRARHRAKLARLTEKGDSSMAQKTDRNPRTPFLNGFTFEQAFDGSTWELAREEDFHQAASTIAAKLREEHQRRYGELQVTTDGDVVTVRRIPGTVA